MYRIHLDLRANWMLRGAATLLWLFAAALLAVCITQLWMKVSALWPLWLALLPIIPFVALWRGVPARFAFPGSKRELKSHAFAAVWRLGLASLCLFFAAGPPTPPAVCWLLCVPSTVFLAGAIWRGVVGTLLLCTCASTAIGTVWDHVRFMWDKHPIQELLERAVAENRDLTSAERLQWQLYLASLVAGRLPRKAASDNQRVRLIAFHAWLRRERQLTENSLDLFRARRDLRSKRGLAAPALGETRHE